MNDVTETPGNPEAGPLAREMAAGVRELVESYKDAYGLSTQEAAARVQEMRSPADAPRALQAPPDQVSWADLEALLRHDPERALQRWGEIQRAAGEDLRSGHRACQAVEVYGSTPWSRAQYLALRRELADGWQPRDGMERQLVDAMAQAQTAAEFWLKRLTARAALASAMEEATLRRKGKWEPPAATGFQTVEQAGAMAERFNRVFLRTLRALRDLRRGPAPVLVQNAGQVNVGQQQVNVARQAGGRKRKSLTRRRVGSAEGPPP